MRFISIRSVQLSIDPKWHPRAEHAIAAIRKLSKQARADAINSKSHVWSDLKPTLETVSNGKCWYCESRQIRSEKAVDHFRPKNRVAESKSEDGYWWLAFDWRNYRFSCTFCNERRNFEKTAGGKGDRFPLLDESKRGRPEATLDDLGGQEKPKLLDPMVFADVGLLTFDPKSGAPILSVNPKTDRIAKARVQESIAAYHLDEGALQKLRFSVMLDVKDKLLQATKLKRGTPEFNAVMDALHLAVQADAEYSAAARAMLKNLRPLTPLAQEVLDGA